MSAQQETRFVCDRCDTEAVIPRQNTPAQGLVAPEGWMTVWIDDYTKAPLHLCPSCGPAHEMFMEGS
jgi:hypothetical protein